MSCRYFNAKYMTIAEIVARRLRSGEFQSGGPFYSRDELARAYHISPGTARAVLRVLEDRGIIACRKGKRPIPACFPGEQSVTSVCRPVFFRDSYTAETPEYDYLAYCMKNLLMRCETKLSERNTDYADYGVPPMISAGEVAVVFPSEAGTGIKPEQPQLQAPFGRIDLPIDQARNDAVSIFTRKAALDCILHLIRHGFASVLRVASKHTAYPWFGSIAAPGALDDYAPGYRSRTVIFDGEFELFPDFLAEIVPACMPVDHRSVAVLIDDPCLSDYLSGEIRSGACRRPLSRCSFFGTAFSERFMAFPYLDLKLNTLAAELLRAVFLKAEDPTAVLPCEFHLIQFRVPEIG